MEYLNFENKKIERSELLRILNEHDIPVETWGIGKAKTIEHLLNEINAGECVLKEDGETGVLARHFAFLAMNVFFQDEGKRYKLVEEKQVFKDGRERIRNLDSSLGEKIKVGEHDINSVIIRGIEEELGIEDSVTIGEVHKIYEEVESMSYPGLVSKRDKYAVDIGIDKHQYKPDGYIEVQEDKTTYFVWKEI